MNNIVNCTDKYAVSLRKTYDDIVILNDKVKTLNPENIRKNFDRFWNIVDSKYEESNRALENVDVLIIVTEWPVFRTPDFDKLKTLMRGRVIFDGRNLFDTKDILSSGFDYYSIGRQTVKVNS